MWGPTKARLFLHELIPQIPLFGTTEFKFMFILKRFKMMKNSKMAANFIGNEILSDSKKNLKVKNKNK